jgi:LysR family nitrogen assimilation transcriptional regulator
MDLRQLRSFLQIVETQSFSKAATLSRISQPALSRQVRMLEEELGVSLLYRNGRGVAPTPAGKVLTDWAQRVLQTVQAARDAVRTFEAEPSGSLSFGTPSSLGIVLTPLVGLAFGRQYPKVRLHLVEGLSGLIHEWILGGRLDMAILYDMPVMGHLVAMPLLEESMVVVGPPNRFTAGEALSPEIVVDLPLVLPARPHRLRLLVDGMAAALGRDLDPMLEIDALPALLEVVRNSGLYTILPCSSVEALVRRNELSVATLEAPQATRRLSLAWPTDRPLSPAGLALQRLVITLVRDYADRFGWRPLAKPLRP